MKTMYIENMKQFILVLFLLSSLCLSAQDIEVKKLEVLEKDQTAVLSPRKDINGVACGLVKVLWDEPGAEFEGNIIGDVQFTGKEYLVYMTDGNAPAKRMGIKHPDYLPITIVFADYGINRIVSGNTYGLVIKGNKIKKKVTSTKKKVVLFNIEPQDAELYIDDVIVPKEEGGTYAISLFHGIHYYSVKYRGFCLMNQVVNVNNKTNEINADLRTFFANLVIKCETQDADVFFNNKYCGQGIWSELVPPGQHVVEVRKNGFSPQSKTIELQENDSLCVSFSQMTAITGRLEVVYKPENCQVLLDGNAIGLTPLHTDVPVGEHQLTIRKDYYKEDTKTVTIEEGQDLYVEGKLDYKNSFSKIWVEAHNGNARYQTELAECYIYNKSYIDGWNKTMVDSNKAIYWYTKAAEQGYANAQCALSYFYNNGKIVTRNYEKSFYWAKKAADQGSSQGFYLLGHSYAYGQGVEKDMQKAIYWLRRAIIEEGWHGHTAAEELLKKLGYESQIPTKYDIE